jgi:hypothetical protein
MAFRATYWSCSKFADWIRRTFRATEKPGAATGSEWNTWKRVSKKEHPVVYWVTEVALDKVQDVVNFVPDQIDAVRRYVVNRWLDKLHYVPTGLKAGEWHETDTRLLHGMFELLVDFVEIEKAWMQVVWSPENWKKYDFPRWYKYRWLRWAAHRRIPQAGIDYLKWEMSLADTNVDEYGVDHANPRQAAAAKEQLELYTWWKTIRPFRPDPHDASGWSAYCDLRRSDDDDIFWLDTPDKDREATTAMLKLCHEIEEQYETEDEEMLIRLIKVRRSLWT